MIVGTADDKMTFSQLKTALESVEDISALEAHKRQTIQEFETAPLETIMNRANSRNELQDRLFELLGDACDSDVDSTKHAVAIDNIKYPPMFVY